MPQRHLVVASGRRRGCHVDGHSGRSGNRNAKRIDYPRNGTRGSERPDPVGFALFKPVPHALRAHIFVTTASSSGIQFHLRFVARRCSAAKLRVSGWVGRCVGGYEPVIKFAGFSRILIMHWRCCCSCCVVGC